MTQLEKQSASLPKLKRRSLRLRNLQRTCTAALPAISLTLGTGLGAGCATTKPLTDLKSPPSDLRELYQAVCPPSGGSPIVTRVEGAASFKVKSPEANGKFSADVVASSSGELQIEVTNPLGGTEAVIRVSQGTYKIEIPGKPEKTQKGLGYWGGIPLHWAVDLFIGKIPCAPQASREDQPRFHWDQSLHALRVEAKGAFGDLETYDYFFGESEDGPRLKKVDWNRRGVFQSHIRMTFQEWNESKQLYKKWSAESKQGEVAVRWQSVDRK